MRNHLKSSHKGLTIPLKLKPIKELKTHIQKVKGKKFNTPVT